MAELTPSSKSYQELLARLKDQIRTAQVRAALAVNRELVLLYWGIGREILQRQAIEGWGSKVVERLAKDLHAEFPEMKGLSRTNLLYMRTFAETWPQESIVQQVVGQIPWGHNVRLLELVKNPEERLWYVHQVIQNGWSRNILVMQIESDVYRRQGKAITNFQVKPEYAGKMNFYLSAVDDMLRHPDDKRSIGLILCKGKNGIVAEYALRDIAKPLGISEFTHPAS
jgi:predicted nuclease of restriction endonuclease-like (RecB) superfamily